MGKNTSLFSQILRLFPRSDFQSLVKRTNAEYHSRGVGCWHQFTAMLFGQLSKANSLSEVVNGLKSCEGKLTHLGVKPIGKSTLAYMNEHRPSGLYRQLFFEFLAKAHAEAVIGKKPFGLKKKLYSVDSTTISLSLSMFDWATFGRSKGAVKLHLRLDHDGYLPEYAIITSGSVHDSRILKRLPIEPDSITALDKGYNDYVWWSLMCERGAYFVTRLKDNAVYEVIEERAVSGKAVRRDMLIRLTGLGAQRKCPQDLRLVEYYDEKSGRSFLFVTNNRTLAGATIAAIYKQRWQIESFFKTIKQNLKVKTFLGTSRNAVETQLWIALIAILVFKYLQMKSRVGWSMSNLVTLLRMNLFTYRDLWTWIDKPYDTPPDPLTGLDGIQMQLAL